MQKKYSFLADNLALMEIRKHQWIESEKQKREIGFATAAVDWIKKYGHTWKLARIGTNQNNDVLLERRRYRRFALTLPLEISSEGVIVKTQTCDISLIGISCQTRIDLDMFSEPEVRLTFSGTNSRESVKFKAKILRCTKQPSLFGGNAYTSVLILDESARDFLRERREVLDHQSASA